MEGRINIITNLHQQIDELMIHQPNLILCEDEEKFILKGQYNYDVAYDGTRYSNSKDIVIHIYKNFPQSDIKLFIEDIPSDMEHVNLDGSICLAAYTEVRSFLRLKPTVLNFINKFFHSFFFSLEWFGRYKQYPFGERSHGRVGMLEYYLEKWNVDEELFKKFALLLFKEKYRGHLECLCGSGLKIRKCHGEYLENIIKDDVLLSDLFVDFCYIYNLKEPSNDNK
ncbi:hypothetical protein ETI06_09735 [Macrococcoides goetzii]|nr:hypothetical protein [Macrococcus goetzii]TDM48744.1 hypothetical protein ETI06_09735 [Macrococcus goetzii]